MTVSPIGGTAKRQRKTRKPVKGAAVSLRLTEEDGLLLNLCAEQLGVNKSELFVNSFISMWPSWD